MRPDTHLRAANTLRQAASTLTGVTLSLGLLTAPARAQDYSLQPGDVIEMSVAGLPDMGVRASIQMDGSLSLPAVGDIDAAGQSISEVRERIRTRLSSKLQVMYLPDGSEITRMVDRDQVSASVVEYRPVFVSGDVAQPGERPFRPGMTARQAITASGGVMSAMPVVTGYDPAALRADYAVAWHTATAAGARVWRLQRELGDEAPFDRAAWPAAPGSDGALDRILQTESDTFETRANNYEREGIFQTEQLRQINNQAEVMRHELEVERTVEQADAEALRNATELSEKGLFTQSRLQDVRSATLVSSTRRLQTEVSLMQLERLRIEVSREMERRAEDRRLDLLDALQKSRIDEEQERARLFEADEKLRAMGVAPVYRPDAADVPEIAIIRSGTSLPEPATYDSRIEPGDVIEVRRTSDAASVTAGTGPDVAAEVQTATVWR